MYHFCQSLSRVSAKVWHRLLPSGLTCSVILGGSAIAGVTIISTPQIAHAYTSRVTLFVPRDPAESYNAFLRQSEAIARAGIQRSFDADLLVSEVIITIVGDNQGIAVPVMEVQVTRSEWQQRPDPQYWARYYNNASVLLDL
jgi:hypothetical protein